MPVTTKLKLPAQLKERIVTLAEQTGRTPHSLMVEAIHGEVEREERMRAFIKEAQRADKRMDCTGDAYAAANVHRWLDQLASGRHPARPKPWRG